MPSPFNYKNKDKIKKPKPMATQALDAIDLGSISNTYGSAPKAEATSKFKKVLPAAPRDKMEFAMPPKDMHPNKPVYKAPRPIRKPSVQSYDNVAKQPTQLNPIIEAYVPRQFKGAEPLAMDNQKRIYSTFKEQMEQLKNK